MKNLITAAQNDIVKNNDFKKDLINTLDHTNIKNLDWRLSDLLTAGQKSKVYTLDQLKEVLTLRLQKYIDKRLLKEANDIENVFLSNFEEIDSIKIDLEWKKSQMWGLNPNGSAYVPGIGYVTSGSIGGCGYDKQSTAVANVLNQIPQFKKLLYASKNKKVNLSNRDLFGYGSGYGVKPYFEGGVGVNCYDRIFNKIGYKFETVSSGKMFDCYRITKITAREAKKIAAKYYSYSN